jgi:hypothetical protein
VRNWLRPFCIGAAVSAMVVGCTMKNASVPPSQLMSELQAGQPMLDCRVDCGLAWANNRQNAAVLNAAGRWQELALLVMQIGYMDDLTYYYLGQAAENLGYLQAAQRYYRIAEQIAVTQMSCRQGEADAEAALGIAVNECAGYVFPDTLYPHLESVEARLAALSNTPAPPPHKRARLARKPSPRTPTAAAASGGGQASGSGFVVPAPTAAPAAGSGFVEPAPAATAAASGSGFVAPSSSDPFAIPPVRR